MNVESNLISTVIGAIVGGAIAALIQFLQSMHQGSMARKDRLRIDQAIAYGIMAKLQRMIRILDAYIRNYDQNAANKSGGTELWAQQRPMPSVPLVFDLTSDEQALLLRTNSGLFNRTILFADRMQFAVANHQLYAAERMKLTEKLQPDETDGTVGIIDTSTEHYRRTALERAALNQMVESDHKHNLDELAKGKAIIHEVAIAMNASLGTQLSVSEG